MPDKPLIVKYRPTTLNDVVGQGACVDRLKAEVAKYRAGIYSLPHCFFSGPPGVGKSTVAQALCADLYGPGWRNAVLSLNASDERGIDVIRGRVKKFASSVANVKGFNIIILDECDNLTPDAQAALRMTTEEYAEQCRFILCANYSNKIIEPIKDRFAWYRFKPLDDGTIAATILKIAKAEGMNLGGFESKIAAASKGSMRRALNLLSQLPETVTENHIKEVAPSLDKSIIRDALKSAFAGDVENAERGIMQCIWDGHDHSEVLEELFDQVMSSQLNRKTKLTIATNISETEYRILFGCRPDIQLRALLSRLALMATEK